MLMVHHIETAKKTVFTVLAVMLAAYAFIVLLTYTPNDPSWSQISSDMNTVSNMGGAAGAWLSDILYSFLGLSAWWLVVFLSFEALSMWWSRHKTYGAFRLIAYSLLLLASSGFIALLPRLFGMADATNWRYGGIVGSEVASQLAGLLTIYGAVLFLFVFAIVTATFGFDILWRKVFGSVFKSSWLGNGVKDNEADTGYDKAQEEAYLVPEDDTFDASLYATSDTDNYDEQATLDKHGQMKLVLPEGRQQSPSYHNKPTVNRSVSNDDCDDYDVNYDDEENDDRANEDHSTTGNVLDEFLVNTGITESILGMHQQTEQDHTNSQGSSNAINSKHNAKVNTRRQEPSFTWNDQHAIDELLDTNIAEPMTQHNQYDQSIDSAHAQRPQPESVATEINSATDDHSSANRSTAKKRKAFSFGSLKTRKASSSQSESTDTNAESTIEVNSEDINQQHIVEQGSIAPDTKPASKRKLNIEQHNQYSSSDYEEEALAPTKEGTKRSAQQQKVPKAKNKPIDLTPTNTPPADPTKAPTIAFDTPDNDSGNYIEDMVPDNSSDALPDIHDDAAYASKSRAMQTAKHRGKLTPIPELSILDSPDPERQPSYTQDELVQLSELLEIKLQDFNVKAEVVNAIPGPVVTRFEVELAAGVKASKVTGISRDLARSLSMASLRVVEVIPGKPYIGIEVPNKKREMVRLIELLNTKKFKDPKSLISMAMGKDIGGKPIITDLARAPHMLVAGTTGSGKSVLVNSMLLSMLLKYTPDKLRLILIDPKQLELANYNDIPHLLTPVVTDMNEAASSLSWCVAEMERRYQLMSLLKVRKLDEFNKKVIAAEKAGKPMIDPLWRPNDSVSIDQAPKLKTLPMIVIVADEFADMIMQVGKQAEELITRLAQKSRAAGIHLMLATQRPSVDVITGLIKANIPVRAALRVNSKVDSRTILDAGGAEDMLGNGDMLFLGPGQIEPERVHGAYVSDAEVNRVCDAWRERGAPDYIDNMASNFELTSPSSGGNTSGEDDQLYDEAVAFIMETRKVSASSIQRKFSIGYNRAARIVDSMEEAGLVSPMGKSGKRELLM